MRRHLLLATLASAVAAPIPTPAEALDDSNNRMVCRRDREPQLGSHLQRQRICRTRAEWRALEELTQNELQQIRDGQKPNEPPPSAIQALDRTLNVPDNL